MSPAVIAAGTRRTHRAGPVAVFAHTSATLLASCDPTGGSAVGAADLDGGAFPASHLREHLATSRLIAVAYRMDEPSQVAHRLVDAPRSTP